MLLAQGAVIHALIVPSKPWHGNRIGGLVAADHNNGRRPVPRRSQAKNRRTCPMIRQITPSSVPDSGAPPTTVPPSRLWTWCPWVDRGMPRGIPTPTGARSTFKPFLDAPSFKLPPRARPRVRPARIPPAVTGSPDGTAGAFFTDAAAAEPWLNAPTRNHGSPPRRLTCDFAGNDSKTGSFYLW